MWSLILFVCASILTGCEGKTFFERRSLFAERWESVSEASESYVVEFDLLVKEDNMDKMREIVEVISNPKESQYANYMTTEEIDILTKPKTRDLRLVTSWLESQGATFEVIRDRRVHVTMDVLSAKTMLKTTFSVIKRNEDGKQLVRAGDYTIPDDVSEVVTVVGLHGLPLPVRPTIDDIPSTPADVTPDVLASTYSISGVDVSGSKKVRQAVAEFQGQYMRSADLTQFFKKYVDKYEAGSDDVVYKFVGDTDVQEGAAEASLDIQYIMGNNAGLKTEFWLWKNMNFCGYVSHPPPISFSLLYSRLRSASHARRDDRHRFYTRSFVPTVI